MIAAEVARIHGDRVDRTRDAEPDDAPVMPTLRTPPAARLPAVHPLATIGVLAIDERRGSRREQVVPGREEFVRRDQCPSADARAREVDETVPHQRTHLPMPCVGNAPSPYTHTPRTNVCRTRPVSVIPAYGVTGCRWCSRSGATLKRASGSNTITSASHPGAIRPLRGRPASPAGRSAHQRARSPTSRPRSCAPVQGAASPSSSDATPPHARTKSPLSRHLRTGGAGEWSLATRASGPA